MIREVDFLSQPRAEYFKPLEREAIISITGSGDPPANLQNGWTHVLRLVFDDVERPIYGATHFDSTHAKIILRWLNKVESKVDKVFVHCLAGKSRSAAVSLFIAQQYEIAGGINVYTDYNHMVHRVLVWSARNS